MKTLLSTKEITYNDAIRGAKYFIENGFKRFENEA